MVAHEPGERDAGALNRSVWMLLSRDATLADHPRLKERLQPVKSIPGLRTWTDDFSSLFQILK
jgi:hypothetical protein